MSHSEIPEKVKYRLCLQGDHHLMGKKGKSEESIDVDCIRKGCMYLLEIFRLFWRCWGSTEGFRAREWLKNTFDLLSTSTPVWNLYNHTPLLVKRGSSFFGTSRCHWGVITDYLWVTVPKTRLYQYLYYWNSQNLYYTDVHGSTPNGEIYYEIELEALIFWGKKHIESHFLQDSSLETQVVYLGFLTL